MIGLFTPPTAGIACGLPLPPTTVHHCGLCYFCYLYLSMRSPSAPFASHGYCSRIDVMRFMFNNANGSGENSTRPIQLVYKNAILDCVRILSNGVIGCILSMLYYVHHRRIQLASRVPCSRALHVIVELPWRVELRDHLVPELYLRSICLARS